MILLVNVCFEKLHYLEFVKPIEDILKKGEVEFFTRHYLDLNDGDLKKCDKVIICGTSLKDDEFLDDIKRFDWLKDLDKHVLGICAGFQILGLVFGGEMKKNLEIGFFYENFIKEFFGMKDRVEVYHLHNNYIKFGNDFEVFAGRKYAQAVKLKDRNFYGVLFHPEVRNKEMILRFCEL